MQYPVFTDNTTVFGDGTEEHPLTTSGGGGTGTETIANGTAALDTVEINSGAAGSVQSIVAAGVLSTDNVLADFNENPTSVLGYEPGAMLTILKWCSVGHVNFLQINNTGSNITPGVITINWRVVR